MKKLVLLGAVLVLFGSCVSNAKITGTWKNSAEVKKPYKVIFVAAMTRNNVMKSSFEGDIKTELEKFNVRGIKSIDEFPPHFSSKDSIPKYTLMKAVKKDGSEAILTITVLKKTTESHYVDGGYSPMQYGYNGNVWGYYNYWYPYTYDDGYYSKQEVYYLESNLYDSKTEVLLWSAQTKAYSYEGISSISKELANTIVSQMKRDGLIAKK